jgi:hypothetical protein
MKNSMKKFFFASAISLGLLASCGVGTETYKLDSKKSELKWKGDFIADGHAHFGTVTISDGTVNYKDGKFENGTFKIDLNSVVSELKGAEAEDLKGSLLGEYIFNSLKADVKLSDITDKEISGKITIGKKELDFTAPSTIRRDGSKMEANSKFTLDFTPMDLMGLKPDPKDTTGKNYINPMISFELKLNLNK